MALIDALGLAGVGAPVVWQGESAAFNTAAGANKIFVGPPPPHRSAVVFGKNMEQSVATYDRRFQIGVYVCTTDAGGVLADESAWEILEGLEALAGSTVTIDNIDYDFYLSPGDEDGERLLERHNTSSLFYQQYYTEAIESH